MKATNFGYTKHPFKISTIFFKIQAFPSGVKCVLLSFTEINQKLRHLQYSLNVREVPESWTEGSEVEEISAISSELRVVVLSLLNTSAPK